jgi:wyosine [tRNA(Phe)-imidazoG37] synthetase (radical SAM superfamily)
VKFDTGDSEKWLKFNRPVVPFSLYEFVDDLKRFKRVILQTMFVKGWNDSADDLVLWRNCLKEIRPSAVQIYTIQRAPADPTLIPVENEFLFKVSTETVKILQVKIDHFISEEWACS